MLASSTSSEGATVSGPIGIVSSWAHVTIVFALLLSACCSPCARSQGAGPLRAAALQPALLPAVVAVIPSADGTRRLLVEAVVRPRPGTKEIHSPATGRTVQVYGRVTPWSDDLVFDRARFGGVGEGTLPSLGDPFLPWWRSDGHLVVDGIPIPRGAATFEHGILEIDVGVVGRWRTERLRLEGPGSEGSIRCGPFILSAKAEAEAITVSAAAWAEEGERDWRAWRARVPLEAFGHGWISEGGLVATDGNGSRLWLSSSSGTGGATSVTFLAETQDLDADSVAPPAGFGWPVTLEVRIPEDVRMTTLQFNLAGLAVPP